MHVLLHHLGVFDVFCLPLFPVFLLLCQSIELELEIDLAVKLELVLIMDDLEPSLLHAVGPVDNRVVVILGSANIEGVAIVIFERVSPLVLGLRGSSMSCAKMLPMLAPTGGFDNSLLYRLTELNQGCLKAGLCLCRLFIVCGLSAVSLDVLQYLVELHCALLLILSMLHPDHIVRETHVFKTLQVPKLCQPINVYTFGGDDSG